MIPHRFQGIAATGGLSSDVQALIEQGYAILRGAAPVSFLHAMSKELDARFDATPFSVGPFHGERTKRFHRLLARSSYAADLVMHQRVLAMVKMILGPWTDFPQLNLSQAVEIHPGAPAQIPHRDQTMFPLPKGGVEFSVNVLWPLSAFTAENGATRLWPNSHQDDAINDFDRSDPIVCTMEPGDVLVFLGSTQHAAGANRSADMRRGVIISYCLGCLNPYENQSLAYSREFARTLDPELAAMIGYRWHRPNLATYDGQCPSILLNDIVPEHLATIDALMPEHAVLVAQHQAATALSQ